MVSFISTPLPRLVPNITITKRSINSTVAALGASVALFKPSFREILLIKRGKAPNKDKWSFPGGRVNPDEYHALHLTALRELAEETAVPSSALKLASLKHAHHIQVNVPSYPPYDITIFTAILTSQVDLVAGDDAADAQFFHLDHLEQLQTTDSLPNICFKIASTLPQLVQQSDFIDVQNSVS